MTRRRRPGFALVTTLALMILLTVVAVGLLSLSTISIRNTNNDSDLAEARASARLALMLALNQLQTELGPDQRISVPADQNSAAKDGRRYWTGVYDAWPAPASPTATDNRPTPAFRRWLNSGDDSLLKQENAATSAGTTDIELVGKGTLGPTASAGFIAVPPIERKTGTVTTSRLAWWVGDQGVKAAISLPEPETSVASRQVVRANLQGAPANAVQLAKAGTIEPFKDLDPTDPNLLKVTTWQQAGLLATDPDGNPDPKAPQPLFHDLAANTTGLLTNVRAGGFRKDLSMYLETSTPSDPIGQPPTNFPAPLIGNNGALFQVNGQDGMRIGELWSYCNLYKKLSPANIAYTTGGAASGPDNPHLQTESDLATAEADPFFYFRRPVIAKYEIWYGFYRNGNNLALVVNPLVTFWNPYDVPVAVTPAYYSIRFHKPPYQGDFTIEETAASSGGSPPAPSNRNVLINLGGFNPNGNNADRSNPGPSYCRNSYSIMNFKFGQDAASPLVLKPGEVLLVSKDGGLDASKVHDTYNINGRKGFNPASGCVFNLANASTGAFITFASGSSVTLRQATLQPNNMNVHQGVAGWNPVGTPHVSINHFEVYWGNSGQLGCGGAFVDFWKGAAPYTATKSTRYTAADKPLAFPNVTVPEVTLNAGEKKYFLKYSCELKTERDSMTGGQYLSRFNPSAPMVDFADLSPAEMAMLPFELKVEPLDGSASPPVEQKDDRGFIGGGNTSGDGTSFLVTHSIPREPVLSLASLQHSMANGFTRDKPDTAQPYYGNSASNQRIRLPMLPQISHAIGNSLAPAVLEKDQTTGSLTGRPLADHSYLANQALWDDWFFSSISPRDKGPNGNGPTQKNLADAFFSGSGKLPIARYRPDLGDKTPTQTLNDLFSATSPRPEATTRAASYLRVEGLFNVNSTSVEAWKAMLGSLRKQKIVKRASATDPIDDTIQPEIVDSSTSDTPVFGLHAPTAETANTVPMDLKPLIQPNAQWTGRRSLNDDQIEDLAEKLVEEVRKRGPFLSLADFINRRPGNDGDLARCGTVQAAIDAAGLNDGFDARLASAAAGIQFPDAETKYPAAMGAPGVLKQADILTPIAPVLSARSDSFVIRGYGEKRDATGTKVLAKAWCEAVVERDKNFVDPTDGPETSEIDPNTNQLKLTATNRKFGRRFAIRSFRWLHPDEV